MSPRRDEHRASPEIAIAGAGFSGTMTAVHLVRGALASGRAIRVRLYEPSGRPGTGQAYATLSPAHLLNVRASGMSALPDDPHHFLTWAQAHDATVGPDDYLPRALYGEYLSEILARERKDSRGCLEVVAEEVRDVEAAADGGLRIHLRSGASHNALRLVLATGHPLPEPPIALDRAVLESGRYRANPWSPVALEGLLGGAALLLLGSGLTAVDVLLDARRQGVRGTIHILSRRGLLPRAHAAGGSQPSKPFAEEGPAGTLRSLTRRLRQAVRQAQARGEDWRPVFDSLRPQTPGIWQSLSAPEKQRFLRHARSYWDVHRHRVAPAIADRVRAEIDAGTTVLHAGRLAALAVLPGGLRATIRPRGGKERRLLEVERIVNCTGPNTGVEMCDSDLTRALLRRGLCLADETGIGLHCDTDGAVIGAVGSPAGRVFTLGPLRKGELWESTAVPEIRVQASVVARRILAGLDD